ncbi:non-ribosomal peptide synthetase [Thalassomonas haliotis]|uniref:Amino acid adenylation domain-containing protein n=1 Tax=Thalassomonas haliotis TaxID=485448 RepID=A0ABY7VFS7_9GAMM|nr:non-ribosomal peptide synthetase [Thalassomonas haliotis]WDE12575.1 amino acid adenylation domain-containing protein [Thalassomonas haliotis]
MQSRYVEIAKRLNQLPGDKQVLFRQKLAEQGINSWQLPIVASQQQQTRLSLAQQRFLVAEQVSQHALYNLCSVVSFDNGLEPQALEQAINTLISRHQVMSTCFRQDAEGNWQSYLLENAQINLESQPVAFTPERSKADWLEQTYQQEQAFKFDLTCQAPFKVSLYREQQGYYLFVTIHHVAFDALSMAVFNRELALLYQGAVQKEEVSLPGLSIQYQDYANWQQTWLTGDDFTRQQSYWQQQLKELPELLALPLDRARKKAKERTFTGNSQQLLLDREQSQVLRQQVNAAGNTLYIHLQTAFAWLLARYSGQDDFCFGSSVANRTREELASLVGPLLNTLVIRHRLNGDPSFNESLALCQQTTGQAFDHQDFPFEQLAPLLEIQTTPYHSPIFQVMFIHVGMESSHEIQLSNTRGKVITPQQTSARFDLSLRVMEQADDTIALELEYSTELFEDETIARLLANLKTIISATLAQPEMRLSQIRFEQDLSTLTGPELAAQQQLITETIAGHSGELLALSDGQNHYNYQQLEQEVIQLIGWLQSHGLGKGQHLGLCMNREPLQVALMLACWRLGIVCIMMDPRQPDQRLESLALDAGAALVVTAKAHDFTQVKQEILAQWPQGFATSVEVQAPDLDSSAYIIYTSGSTGKPKGTVISHRALSHYASAFCQQYPQPKGSKWLTLATVAADLGLTSVLAALYQGQCLLLPDAGLAFDPPALAEFLTEHSADCLKITPSHLNALLSLENPETLLPKKALFLGGEGLTADLFNKLTALTPELEIINHYGPTEATVGVCANKLSHIRQGISPVAPLGTPLPGMQLQVCDNQGNIVPRGVVGELRISGPQLASGYWQAQEQTAASFIRDAEGKRYYATGDRVRLNHNGLIEYLGRSDDQVKRRGYRIELGEISACLCQQSEVEQACVLMRQQNNRQLLVAWLQMPENELANIKQKIEQALPEYMVPDTWLCLEQLPLNANGKIDRSRLPGPELEQQQKQERPLTANEQKLAEIWLQLLTVDKINADDDFFALGGDSIKSLQMIGLAARQGIKLKPLDIINNRSLGKIAALAEGPKDATCEQLLGLYREILGDAVTPESDFYQSGGDSIMSLQLIAKARGLGISFTPKMLMDHSSPAALSRAVREQQSTGHAQERQTKTSQVSLPRVDRNQPQALSLAQQRLWFMQQLEPTSTAYNLPAQFDVKGELDLPALSQSCLALVQKHEMLRCRYFAQEDKVFQQVARAYQPLEIHDAQDNNEANRNRVANKVFDLNSGQLIAIDLFPLAPAHYHLIFNIHHIATDGWSMGLLIQDFLELYRNFQQDPQYTPAQEDEPGYLDYVAYRHGQNRQTDEALSNYWLERLAGMPHTLALPADHPWPTRQSNQGATAEWQLESELTQQLETYAAGLKTTPFTVLLAAFQLLLWRYSGQTDFAVGIPVSGREDADSQNMVGVFINTLINRAQISPELSAESWLKQMSTELQQDLSRQEMPLEQLLESLNPERDLSRPPVFQALFNYQADHQHKRALNIPGLSFTSRDQAEVNTKFELSFNLLRRQELSVQIEYNSALFQSDTISQLFGDYQQILTWLTRGQQQSLSSLKLMSAGYNFIQQPSPEIGEQDDFIRRFEQQTAKTPDAVAVVADSQNYSYQALNSDANRLAHWLVNRGIGQDQLVAFCLPRSYQMLMTLLAIQKAGAAYLPLDPKHPQQRISGILAHAKAELCLCDQQTRTLLESSALACPLIDLSSEQTLAQQAASNPQLPFVSDALAYTLYTSGSTGTPKGVEIERRNFAAFLRAIESVLPSFERILALTTITFDIAGLELCLPLTRGATAVIADEQAQRDPELLAGLITDNSVDLIQATPASWRLLSQLPERLLAQVHAVSGGEALDVELATSLQNRCRSLINVYGPTETTVWSSYYPVSQRPTGNVPIGTPLPHNRMYVLDGQLMPVPLGVAGELYIGGNTLARGYRFNPEQTQSSFIQHPEFGRLYRTGDRVKCLRDGQLNFIGRVDFQLKVRGYRIEPGEIESALLLNPQIRAAAVTVVDNQLVAYLESREATQVDSEQFTGEIHQQLKLSLPAYMLPNLYQVMEKLPVNSNNKIDRKALPAPVMASREQAAPLTDAEQRLAAIWQELLKVDFIKADDNFFSLGGHSLLAARLKARLNRENLNLPLQTLFEHPLLSEQAKLLQVSQYQQIPVADRDTLMPLSDAQRRIWFMQQLDLSDASFNMQTQVQLQGSVSVAAMKQAVLAVSEKHEMLRVTYHAHKGEAAQKLNPELVPAFAFIDLREKAGEIEALAEKNAAIAFDLSSESPLRLYLYQTAEATYFCQLVQHHIASDAWSMSLLIDDLILAYQQALDQHQVSLEKPEVDYLDYAAWQNNDQIRKQQSLSLDYWRKTLTGIPAQLALPFDQQRAQQADSRGDVVSFTVPAPLTAQLSQLASQQQCSLFMLLMAAYSTVLHNNSQSQDVVIGTDVANRDHGQLEKVIGFFINLLPLRFRPKATQRFSEYLQSVRHTCLSGFEHQMLPFDRMVEALQPERIPGVHPLIQALFVMQNTPDNERQLDGLTVKAVTPRQQHSKFDMALFANETFSDETFSDETFSDETFSDEKSASQGDRPAELSFNWVYRTGLFNKNTIEALRDEFLQVLAQIVAKPETPLKALSKAKEESTKMSNTAVSSKKTGKLSKLSKMKKLKTASEKPQVTAAPLNPDRPFPLLVQCHNPSLDPLSWARQNQQQILSWLEVHAGIVFRGFNLPTELEFEQFCVAIYPELYAMYGDLPKNDIGSKIYKSTPYPEDQMIMYHNESSHQHRWPRRQWFYCSQPSPVGGHTPIVDCREMYQRLPENIREKLEQKHLCYVRNFSGLDVSWQHFFKTQDRSKVEALCQQNDIDYTWYGEDNLRISQVCPAVITHPVTGEKSFFNQIQLHHFSFLEADVQQHLLTTGGLDNLPRNVCYGDMEPLEQEVVDLISELYEACAVRFDWQKADVVMVDNMLAAHARDPFEGKRKIAVAMGDIYQPGETLSAPPLQAKHTGKALDSQVLASENQEYTEKVKETAL